MKTYTVGDATFTITNRRQGYNCSYVTFRLESGEYPGYLAMQEAYPGEVYCGGSEVPRHDVEVGETVTIKFYGCD